MGHGVGGPVVAAAPVRDAFPAPPPVYTMIPGDGTASGAVAEGTFLVNDLPARVLFDSGAIHSFVDLLFVESLELRPTLLYPPMSVSTPLG